MVAWWRGCGQKEKEFVASDGVVSRNQGKLVFSWRDHYLLGEVCHQSAKEPLLWWESYLWHLELGWADQ